MKYIFLFVFAIMSSSYLFAQPVLTSKSIPQVGEMYSYSYYDTVGVKQGEAGAGITWDFSKLKKLNGADETVNFEIVDPSNTPKGNLFKEATYAYKQSLDNDNNAFGYYKSSNDKIERLGTGFDGGAEILSDLEITSKFPFTYQNSYSDKFIGKLDVMADEVSMTLNRGGEVSVLADAYGTLVLPNGSFKNVLRLKITQKIGDTLPPPIPGFSGGLLESITETYAWLSDDYKFALLTISFITSKTTLPGTPVQTVNTMNVTVYDFEPSGEQTLSTPTIKAPTNGATKLSIPVKLEWDEAILSKTNKKNDEIQQSIVYTVHVADNPEFSDVGSTIISDVSETFVNVENLIEGTKYYWKVKANIDEVESSWSEVYNFTTKLPKPAAPTLLSPINGSSNNSISSLQLKWESNNDVTATRIKVSGPNNFDETVDKGTAFELTNLTPNSTYNWKVKFYNADGDSSDWSEEWTFTTEPETSVDDNLNSNNIEIITDRISNNIKVKFQSILGHNVNILVFDLNGNIVLTKNMESAVGNNIFQFGLPNVSIGLYFIQLNIDNKIYSKSIILE